MDDRGGAGGDQSRGREVERADVIQRPAGEAQIARREAELDEVCEVLPRQVGMGDHDALGTTRRPRCVHQTVHVVRVGGGLFDGVAGGLELIERRPPVGSVGFEARPQQRGLQTNRRCAAQFRQRRVAHQSPGFGMIEDVAHLGRRQPPVDRHRDRAQVVGRKDGLEELRAVVREEGDDVPLPDSALVESGGQGPRSIGHLAVRADLALEHRHGAFGRPRRVMVEHTEPVHVRPHPLLTPSRSK